MVIKYSFFSLLLLLCLSACTKISETNIGTGLIPPVDGVITKDTDIAVYAKNTSSIDTVKVAMTEDHVLGFTNDPLFGTTTAAINVQMQPTLFPFTFGTGSDFKLDSVVMSLSVRGVWGDMNQPLSLHVQEINNEDHVFLGDSTYSGYTYTRYNNYSTFPTINELGSAIVDPKKLSDSFNFRQYGDSGTNVLRVRLNNAFGNRLLSSYDTLNAYKNDTVFREAVGGFRIYADSNGLGTNSLVRIGIANTNSGVTAAETNTYVAVYYNYLTSSGTRDTTVAYFTVNPATSGHSNYIRRDMTGTPAGSYYPNTSTADNDEYLYVQSSPGTISTLTLDSGVAKLPNWIIHRASIVMEEAAPSDISIFDTVTAPYLFMVVKDNNGIPFITDTTKFVIPGFNTNDISTSDAIFQSSVLANYGDFGGLPYRKYNETGVRINYYDFNLSRYIQGIVTNKNPLYPLTLFTPYRQLYQTTRDTKSYVTVSSTPPNPAGIGRVRLYGGGKDSTNTHRMKLHIVYSIPH